MMKKLTLLTFCVMAFAMLMAQQVPTNWSFITPDFTAAEETVNYSEGTKAAAITWTSQTTQTMVSETFSVTAGSALVVSLDVIDNTNTGRTRFGIGWNGGNINWTDSCSLYTVDGAGFQTLTFTGNVPAGATNAYIQIRFYDEATNWAGTATNIIDKMIVTVAGGSNLVLNGGFELWSTPVLNPTLAVNSPTEAQIVNADNVNVVFTVSNFVLGTDGKVEYKLNGGTAMYATASPFNVTGLTVGANVINVQLVNMSNVALAPAVTVTRNITYEIPSSDPGLTITSPTNGATIYSQDVNIAFTLANFVLGTDGKIAYSIDGGSTVYFTVANPIVLSGLTYAAHTVILELVDMSESSLSPIVITSVGFTCVEAIPGGMETFVNSIIGGTYADGSFVGDEGFTWNYFHSRDTGAYPINGKGLMLRRGSDSKLESTTISGGIASFQASMKKGFTGASIRQLELYINGELKGTSQEFGSGTGENLTVYTFDVSNINVLGDFTMMIKPVGVATTNSQVVIDDISWTGYNSTDPYLSISSPANMSTVTSSDVNVAFNAGNFVLGTDGSVKYALDGGAVAYATGSPITFLSLADGQHTVQLELVDMSNASLTPAVTAGVTFTVNTVVPSTTPIYDIQYTTNPDGNSPVMDQTTITRGVVTAISGTKFWIQDGAGSWNGLYVFTTMTPTPVVGDSVIVAGTVVEYFTLTELGTVTSLQIVNSANTVAAPTVATTGAASGEMYESTLVRTTGVCIQAPDTYGIWAINDGSGVIFIDDLFYSYTPVVGHSYTVSGVQTFSFDQWKILPRSVSDITDNGVSTDPLLIVSTPVNNATIYTDNTNVVFSVANFVLGTDGKVAWNVDGAANAYVTASPIAITGLSEGAHVINLQLVNMSNQPLSVPVTAVINITVNLSGPTYTSIYDIQYTTNANGNSPVMNQVVWIRGVVSANFNGSPFGEGYYVQQGGGAWNGIYIFDLVNAPAIGDSVEIAGTVKESFYMTRIETVTSFTIVGVDGIVAAPVAVSTLNANNEQYEACLIKVSNAECTIAQNTYGEWTVNDGTGAVKAQDNGVFVFTEALGTRYDIIGLTYYSYGAFEINYRILSDITISSGIDSEFASQISVYPNPASDFVTVNVPNGSEMITIVNMVGQVINQINVDSETTTINIENLEAGVYFVKIAKADKIAVVRIVVE